MTDDTDTMKDVSHTNPYTGKSTGQLFRRGPAIAADGGRPEAGSPDENGDADEEPTESADTMSDVSHTPPTDSEAADRVFERGGKERVDDDEGT